MHSAALQWRRHQTATYLPGVADPVPRMTSRRCFFLDTCLHIALSDYACLVVQGCFLTRKH